MTVPGWHLPHPTAANLTEGACRNTPEEDMDRWFPTDSLLNETLQALKNRDLLWNAYCRTCPVNQRCLKWALQEEEYGIWAGSTEQDRLVARKDVALANRALERISRGLKPFQSHVCVNCEAPVHPSAKRCGACSRKTDARRRKALEDHHYRTKPITREQARVYALRDMTRWRHRRLTKRPRHDQSRYSNRLRASILVSYEEKIARLGERIRGWEAR